MAAAVLLATPLLVGPAQAKGPRVQTFPPTNMVVECNPVARVTGNVPARTGYVSYSYFKADPYYDYGLYLTPQVPGYGYLGFEGGPGYDGPTFPAVYQKGGPTYTTDVSAVMVRATAYRSERATTALAFGFATCFGRDPIPIVFGYGGSTYRYVEGGAVKVG